MRILLIGEYSNVHWTLAEGLRLSGHDVTVVSNGDFWKNYRRDISLTRRPGKAGGIVYMAKLLRLLPRMRGYDVVQLINPMFLELKARWLFSVYRYLRRHNRKVFLCGYGMDYYWVKTCCEEKPLRYSDFNIGDTLRTNDDAMKERKEWLGTDKERLNRFIASDCDGIITGLYEYWVCYNMAFPQKTHFVPFPIKPYKNLMQRTSGTRRPVRVFVGINRSRNEYKGTDIMLHAAETVARRHPGCMEIIKAVSLPFSEYRRMMDSADIILDQLYSYTPAMNALLAMSKGIVCVGGGEEESYAILEESRLRPIVNVQPCLDDVIRALESIVTDTQRIDELKRQSVEYIRIHHDYAKVARQYESIYNSSSC